MVLRTKKKKKEKLLFDITGAKVKKKPDLKAKLDKEFSLFIGFVMQCQMGISNVSHADR